MPPLPVLAGVHLASIEGGFEGLPSTNTFCFSVLDAATTETVDQADALAVSTALAAHWPAFATSAMPATYSATAAGTYCLGHPLVPRQIVAMVAPGGAGITSAPGQVAYLIKHDVSRRGKGSQSRSFMSPVSNFAINPDGLNLNVAEQSSYESAFNTFMNAVTTDLAVYRSAWTFVQLSKKGAGATYPILASQVELRLATQRRRIRRSG